MTTLNIGTEAFNSTEIATKVQADISFLVSRIALLNEQPNPNPVILSRNAGKPPGGPGLAGSGPQHPQAPGYRGQPLACHSIFIKMLRFRHSFTARLSETATETHYEFFRLSPGRPAG